MPQKTKTESGKKPKTARKSAARKQTGVTPEMAVRLLKERYPTVSCALEYGEDPWRLLVMGRLSAQCTDARVNEVCRELFRVFPTAQEMAQAELGEIEALIRSCGLYRMKAKNLRDASRMLLEKYDGKVPDTMEELLTLPGVGRKIANLLLGDIYHQPAIVADTHCIRISGRMGFCQSKDPLQVERALVKIIPPEEQSDFCHRLVWFGREVCRAQNPDCGNCPFPCKQEIKRTKKAAE